MKFSRVVIEAMAVELPPEVWTSAALEEKLAPLYARLKLPYGRLELMTGIRERRFWPHPIRPSEASALAGRKVMTIAGTRPEDIDLLIHSSVCRDRLEPATAAYVHGLLGLETRTQIFDLSDACLGFLNAMTVAAGLIESGQIRRALICSGENGRPLVENTIAELNADTTLSRNGVKPYFANLTIGAGAVAAILAREDVAGADKPHLIGGAVATDSAANRLCEGDASGNALAMRTDSEKLLAAGIALAARVGGLLRGNRLERLRSRARRHASGRFAPHRRALRTPRARPRERPPQFRFSRQRRLRLPSRDARARARIRRDRRARKNRPARHRKRPELAHARRRMTPVPA